MTRARPLHATLLTLAFLAGALWAPARAQNSPPAPPFTGTGRWPAISESIENLPTHTLYRPRDLAALKGAKLPILAWANGNCVADSSVYRAFLTEIASHGYLIVALGPWRPPGPGQSIPTAPPGAAPTQPAQLLDGIAWAQAENGRKGGPLEGRLAVKKIAVPSTRVGGLMKMDSRKSLRSIASARSLSLSKRRPCFQVIMSENTMPPIMSGNQPPWNSLSKLDVKNARSTTKKHPVAAMHSTRG